mmetsp:Transcript_29208/g.50473  ORF Transcript_29208/g.50473 Transcript_29208/m.50473 type:complete len:394 (-) Transcript_29208:371-1552(-)
MQQVLVGLVVEVVLLGGVLPDVEDARDGVEHVRVQDLAVVLRGHVVRRVPAGHVDGVAHHQLVVPPPQPHDHVVLLRLHRVQHLVPGPRADRAGRRQRAPLVVPVQVAPRRGDPWDVPRLEPQGALQQRGEPVRDMEQVVVGGAADRAGQQRRVHKGVHLHAALVDRVLLPPQRLVAAHVVRAPAVVRGDHDDRVVVHAVRLQVVHQVGEHLVHRHQHLAHHPPRHLVDGLGQLQLRFSEELVGRVLQRHVHELVRVEQEQGLANVVVGEDLLDAALEDLGRVPAQGLHVAAVEVHIVEERPAAVQHGGCDLVVVVGLLPIVVPEEVVEAAVLREECVLAEAEVPLAHHLGLVLADKLEYLREDGELQWKTPWLGQVRGAKLHADLGWVLACQ